jgi:hypothetical protein
MNPDIIFAALFGAGGTGALAGAWNIIQSFRKGKLENEETLIRRLDEDNKRQARLADEALSEASRYRRQRNKAQDQAARFRRKLISLGADDNELEELEEYND